MIDWVEGFPGWSHFFELRDSWVVTYRWGGSVLPVVVPVVVPGAGSGVASGSTSGAPSEPLPEPLPEPLRWKWLEAAWKWLEAGGSGFSKAFFGGLKWEFSCAMMGS